MPGSTSMSIRVDPELKAKAEDILSQLGMNMTGAVNMFLMQIVRDRAVPLSLSLEPQFLSTKETLHADLMAARRDREMGIPGIPAEEALTRMGQIIAEAEQGGA